MRESFTQNMRQVLSQVQREARGLNQEFVGTEHLLLGMLGCPDCGAAKAMAHNGIGLAEVRQSLLRLLPHGDQPPVVSGDLPLSPKAQRMIQNAIVKAQAAHAPAVSSSFLLLALLEDATGVACQAIRDTGGDVDRLRQSLLNPAPDSES